MSGAKALVPELRFPGFAGEWKRQRLSSVLKTKGRRNTDLQFGPENVLSVSGELGVVNQIEHLGRSYAGASVAPYHVVETGDVVYTKSPLKANPFGIVKTNRGAPGIVSTLYAVYEVRDGHDPNFWDRYFELDDRTNRYLKPLVNKGAKNDMKISNERVLIDPVIAPALSEQQKIAAFLDTVSRKIVLLGEKKGALVEYKRGLMQRLFSRELRFSRDDGSAFPDWQERRIGDVLTPSQIAGSFGDTARKLSVQLWARGVRETERSGSPSTRYYTRRAGQFIYSKLDFLNCAFGIVPTELDGLESTVDLPAFDISTAVEPSFLLNYVIRRDFYERYGATADGSRKARRIQEDVFMSFPLRLPHLDEQRKIAATLSALDKKIDATAHKISELEAFKKGLLQKLFV